MPSSSDNRTRTPAARVGETASTPAYGKEFESCLDAYIRDEAGLSFDAVGAGCGLNGETLRLMLDPGDRHQLGASRTARVLRRLGTAEPFNRYMRIDGNQIGGVVHQLVPVVLRPCTGNVLVDLGGGARELGAIVEEVAGAVAGDGKIDAIEAAAALRLVRPHVERLMGVVAQLEAIARRES